MLTDAEKRFEPEADRGRFRPACTALDGPGSRCGSPRVVRDFCSSLYPEGPALRLCAPHAGRYHRAVLRAIADAPGSMQYWEKLADEWRWAPDCVRT